MEETRQKTLVQAENVTLSYDGRPVVGDVNFTVTEGMYLCIVGANGSGKSTLMRAITGMLRPTTGTLTVSPGVTIGYLPQQSEIQRDFPASVWEVALSGCLGRVKNRIGLGFGYDKDSRERAEKALSMLGMSDKKKRSYNELSGGQQQRVLLARALCASDTLLLLDEPVTGLDPDATRDMYAMIRRLNANGTAILMVTHDMEAALEESTHILCLCQRHGGSNHANFFGETADYRASLGAQGEETCSCCGMEHTHSNDSKTILMPKSPQIPIGVNPIIGANPVGANPIIGANPIGGKERKL